ncbi:MAG: baseplate J/gp47 family protein [Acinetobacter sp.]|nr:baseplate J/gp47 family protein [Acinetobacter sp.]
MTITNRNDIQVVDADVKQILKDSIAQYEQHTGKTLQPAHIEQLLIHVYAYREMLTRQAMNEAFRQTFPQTAIGVALDLCGETFGCYRLQNKAARCILRFSVQGEHASIVIAKGTQVAVNDEIRFRTLNDDVITPLINYVDIEAECTQTGTVGNGWQIGQINRLQSPLPNVAASNISVHNIDIPSGGLVEEDDDAYRKRILAAPEAFSSCGSIAAYDYHARSVSQDIADVKVSTPQGGQVRITVLSKNGTADNRLLQDIQRHLSADKLRPLCDQVEVIAATRRDYRIDARLKLLSQYREDLVRTQAQNALQQFLSDKTRKLGVDIVPSAIIAALRVEGVYDVELIQPQKMLISEHEWANCTAINLTIDEQRHG